MATRGSSVTAGSAGPRGRLYAGSSGFSYAPWRPGFYPPGTRPKDFLRFYSGRLPSVELNTTFYQLPSQGQLEEWAAATPAGFRFSVKMTGRITHGGRLELVGEFCERMHALGDRLGPILVQFPETRPRDDGLLQLLLDSLDPSLEYAFEFRHESWANIEVPVRVGALEGSAPFRYLRLREPPYDDGALAELAARIRPVLAHGVDVYAYFKHEDDPTAPRYAQGLLELI